VEFPIAKKVSDTIPVNPRNLSDLMTPISCISKSQADVNGATTQPIYMVLKEKAGVKDIDWYVLPIRLAY
jgi:hypothetical protein